MKLLFDLFPVILFFAAFKVSEGRKEGAAQLLDALFSGVGVAAAVAVDQAPILVATVVVILATCTQIAWVWLRHGKVDKMLWISLGLVVVLGGLTLALRDDTFIKWKPTILYWVFAATLLISATLLGKNLVRTMLGAEVSLPESDWSKLNLVWVGFFVLMGAVNLFVARSYPTDIWVNFKLFGGMGLMLVFMLAQGFWLMRRLEDPAAEGDKPDEPPTHSV
jgi:intracellular septation protein